MSNSAEVVTIKFNNREVGVRVDMQLVLCIETRLESTLGKFFFNEFGAPKPTLERKFSDFYRIVWAAAESAIGPISSDDARKWFDLPTANAAFTALMEPLLKLSCELYGWEYKKPEERDPKKPSGTAAGSEPTQSSESDSSQANSTDSPRASGQQS